MFITGSEAYPELERAFLAAETEIHASFRIFDPRTRLRSAEGLAVGESWSDLIAHVLQKGVAIRMILSDFDPVGRSALHRGTWRSVRLWKAAAASAGPDARLEIHAAMHPAQSGTLVRMAFWWKAKRKTDRICAWLNEMPEAERHEVLEDMPGLSDRIVTLADGRCRARRFLLPHLFPATHHQKLAVFDRRKLYIGGLDLDERRYDTPNHDRPGDQTWHDVQMMMEGPVVTEAQAHLDSFLDVVEGKNPPAKARRFLRTLSRRRRIALWHYGPKPVAHELRQAHEALCSRAQNLIYLETQFFRDLSLARHLVRAAERNPQLGLILILPAAPEDVAFDNRAGIDARFGEYQQARALRMLRKAFGARIFIGGAAQPRSMTRQTSHDRDRLQGAPLIYIHAKVSIFDDVSAIVSSANLNGRSLSWDTEAGVYLNSARDVAELRRRAMGHWLPADAAPAFFDVSGAPAAWAALARENHRAAPENRRGFILPYDITVAEDFGQNAPGVPDEMM